MSDQQTINEQRHVIIRGHVFPYEEKQPFVVSGMSVLGALEYNESDDTTKCHECGEWSHGLGWHLRSHGIKPREYKAKHGIRQSSALAGLRIRKTHFELAKRLTIQGKGILSTKTRHPRPIAKSAEWHNQNSRCNAQLLFRLQVVAATVGHTPNRADLRASGVHHSTLQRAFGSIENAMRLAELEPNGRGKSSPLPRAFPPLSEIKKKWNERMPWPKEYFEVESKMQSSISGCAS